MRVHVELLGEMGQTVRDATIDSVALTVGGSEVDDFVVEGLPVRALEVGTSGARVVLRARGQSLRYLTGPLVVDLGGARVRITVYPRVQQAVRGACPVCRGSLTQRTVGGAYRTMARSERRCAACQATILTLAEAARELGAFSQLRETSWVHVEVPMRCPECLGPLERWHLRTAHGEAQVERCLPCAILVLDRDDTPRLTGDRL